MRGANLRFADLSHADLSRANLEGSDLYMARFHQTVDAGTIFGQSLATRLWEQDTARLQAENFQPKAKTRTCQTEGDK